MTAEDFAARYGRWALVAGASEGVGAAFAHALAERGLDVVLLARRKNVLDEVAAGIRTHTGVETRTAAVDLARADAMAAVARATDGLEVGLVVYCAGADPSVQPFLAQPVEAALAMAQRNCVAPLELFHHFAGPMAARRRGGLALLGSGAGLAGAPNLAVYGASKAFDMVLAEALWAELQPQGVDVLGLILGETDTPALRRLRERLGRDDREGAPISGAANAADVVREALENLANGPTWMVGDTMRAAAKFLGGLSRGDAVRLMMQASAATMVGAKREPAS